MNYFDIHTHIAPNIDDGARNEDVALRMLQLEYDSGVRNIILTPHYREEKDWIVSGCDVASYVQSLAAKISKDLKVYPGNEVFFSNDIKQNLHTGKATGLANSKYVLLEFHYDIKLHEMYSGVNEVLMAGFWPIIAHAERYECLYEKGAVEHLVNSGGYVQINADSIISGGFKMSHFIKKLFKADLVGFVASDCHSAGRRRPNLGKCAEILNKRYGEEVTNKLLFDNPMKIINNQRI